MRDFPKHEAFLLKGLIRAFDQLPELKRVDEASKILSVPPGKKKLPRLAAERKKSLNGRLLSNILEALDKYGFGKTAQKCWDARTLNQKFGVLRDFLILLEAERGPVETWPELLVAPATDQAWPRTVEDLLREWKG